MRWRHWYSSWPRPTLRDIEHPREDIVASRRGRVVEQAGPWGFVFFLAYIGAAIYFVSESDGGFWGVILGLLQAIVWPVYVIFWVLTEIGA